MIVIPEDVLAITVDDFLTGLDRSMPRDGSGVVEIDCSHIQRVTSAHINVLWQARLRYAEAGVEIRLRYPSTDLIRVLRLLDLYDIFMGDEPYTEKLQIVANTAAVGRKERVLELKFRPETSDIDNALVAFRQFLEELRVTGASAFELETAFYEVVTNIRLHGRLKNEDTVEFKAQCLPDRLLMKFIDPGQPFDFDPRRIAFNPRKAMDEGQKRGFGLVMIGRMTDKVRYERQDQRFNVLMLEKLWRERNNE